MPTSARIETDPSQDAASQMQSSVRHVAGPAGHSHSSSAIAPPSGQDFDGRNRSTSTGSQPEGQSQQVPYRARPNAGPMGVAS